MDSDDSDFAFASDEENFPQPPKQKVSKASKTNLPKPNAPAPLQSGSAANAAAGRTIEQTYQKKTQLEHVLLRPDTYVGSVQLHTSSLWVYENEKMVLREVSYVPGLYKIFDEILVNAADNKQRDPSMDLVKVTIDPESNTIQVWNNGKGVPVEIHAEEKVHVPELVFGHLLTSSNYDDSEQKTTGGRNGYGAKLTNIYSTEFIVETADGERSKKYKQVFRNNMGSKSEPSITKCKKSENWTCITFKPDLEKFKMTHLDQDIVALMSKRVVDIAGCLGKSVKVFLNGTQVPVKSFADYCALYLDSAKHPDREEPLPKVYERINDNWEVCVSVSDGQFQQVSFVNSIATIKGGSHVQLVTDQIVKFLLGKAQKKLGKANSSTIKAHQVKSHLWVFVNALIVNPAFDSQTKETLNTRPTDFGSTCKLPEKFLEKTAKTGIVENLLSFATFKANKDMKKSDGSKRQRLTGISKLDDANDAGGKGSEECTLILTEGDSAKALAISGLSVVGRNKYGVFPLRGKLLNVREASHKQIMENTEIANIKQIMGLQQGKQYDSTKSLRYGHLMIMTDQDHDGSHIKGLLINFLHAFWPSLLKQPSFLLEFITPIVKATSTRGQVLSFYTMPEYEAWKESLGGNTKGWSVKYYKGLGTSTPKEAKEYFARLEQHKKDFSWQNDTDGECIEMAFSKKRVEERKQWLRNFEPGTYLDQTVSSITYSDFVNKELILFSMADNIRSIPSVMDGMKPGQRKIVFSCFKRKLKSDVKVAQLAGYISEHSAYHHGEASLMGTIIGLAQDFVGSNNVNLLVPSGQFGTRLQGGKDAASPRYIYTRLHVLTRILFPEADDVLLNFLNEDGQKIEPQWYVPILPLVLVNGSEGIGTGWSSSVPMYNPRDIVANLKRLMQGQPLETMTPWYRGFKGTVSEPKSKEGTPGLSYTLTGIINKKSDTVLEITELPVGKWTQDYKEFLETMLVGNEKGGGEPFLKDMREYHTDTSVHFELHLSEQNMAVAEAEGLVKKFKLTSSVSTSNMNLFDKDGKMLRYETPEQIIEYFYGIRLDYYEKRKAAKLEQLAFELRRLDNRVRFILSVVNGEIIVNNRRRADLLAELKAKDYPPMPKSGGSSKDSSAVSEEDEASENSAEGSSKASKEGSGGYEYLLGMPLWSLTLEKVEELLNEQKKMKGEYDELQATSPKTLWERDLDHFLVTLEEAETLATEERAKEAAKARMMSKKGGSAKKVQRKTAPKAKAKASAMGDDDIEIDSDDSDFEIPKPTGKTQAAKAQAKSGRAPTASTADNMGAKVAEVAAGKAVKPRAAAAPPDAGKKKGKTAVASGLSGNASAPMETGSEDEFGGSLLDRLAKPKPSTPSSVDDGKADIKVSLGEEPEKTAGAKKRGGSAGKKKADDRKRKTTALTSKLAKLEVQEDDDDLIPLSEAPGSKVQKTQEVPFSKSAAASAESNEPRRSARPARQAHKKPQYNDSDSSSALQSDEDDDDDEFFDA